MQIYHMKLNVLFESEIDKARQEAIESGKLTENILVGMPLVRAVRDDGPYVREGQIAVQISQNGDNRLVVFVVDNTPTAIISNRFNWEHSPGKFTGFDKLPIIKDIEVPDSDDEAMDFGREIADISLGESGIDPNDLKLIPRHISRKILIIARDFGRGLAQQYGLSEEEKMEIVGSAYEWGLKAVINAHKSGKLSPEFPEDEVGLIAQKAMINQYGT